MEDAGREAGYSKCQLEEMLLALPRVKIQAMSAPSFVRLSTRLVHHLADSAISISMGKMMTTMKLNYQKEAARTHSINALN